MTSFFKHQLSYYIFFLVLYTSNCVFSQEKIGVVVKYGAENDVIPKQGDTIREYYKNTEVLKYIKYVDNKYLYIIGYYKDGVKDVLKRFPLYNLKDKKIIYYYKNGKVMKITNYKKGLAHGQFKEFYKNGILKLEKYYLKIRKDSIWKYYDIEGNLLKKEFFDKGALLKRESYKKGVLLKKEEYN